MSDAPESLESTVARRDFLRLAGLGTGALITGGLPVSAAAESLAATSPITTQGRARATSHVIVVGAGAWGAFTSWHLRKAGHRVTLIDQYGVANSRATSGDETRGIRSSYGDRTLTPELWTAWARKSIQRWREFDAEHAKRFGTRYFFTTGDVILREKTEPFTTKTMELWNKLGVKYEVLTTDDAKRRWPQINSDGQGVVVYEPDAGVARARDSIQAVVALGRDAGVEFRLGKVTPGPISNGRMNGITLGDGTKLEADAYVFCCGPWMEKVLPMALKNKTRLPIGHVCYFGTPIGDDRFTYPNIPTWNVPGVTGWAALPVDSRGFRVRGAIAPPAPPRAAGAADAPPPPPPPSNATPPDPRQQDPDLSSRWSSQERIDGSRRVLAKYFPALADAPLLETRSCHYESSVNRNFIVDRVPGAENAWIAGMGQAEGFKFSIVMGEYAAWRVLGDSGDPTIAEAFRLPTQEYDPQPATNTSRGEDDE
jgi:glycine/D-amino acid oxidase-like deaminating enzyme